MTEFFGGGDDLLERFFGGGGGQRRSGQGGQGERPAARAGDPGRRHRLRHQQGRLHPHQQPRGRGRDEESRCRSTAKTPTSTYEAKVVGRDPLTDSALIQLTEKPRRELTEVKFGDSAQMEPGDWVMAIGNPFGLAHTVSVGVISATERPFPITDGRQQDVLQTDAAINPGNSGGPLLNVRGEVVGINTAIYTDSRQQGNIGIGFAMPINTVRELLPQLRTGKITRGVIGVAGAAGARRRARPSSASRSAAARWSPSSTRAARRPRPASSPATSSSSSTASRSATATTWCGMVVSTKPGTTVPVKVLRDKQEKTLNLTVDELNLEAETTRTARGGRRDAEPEGTGVEPASGMTMGALTADIGAPPAAARRHRGRAHHRRRAGQPGVPRRPAARRRHPAGEPPRRSPRRPRPAACSARCRRQHRLPADPAQRPGDVRHRAEAVAPAASRVHYSKGGSSRPALSAYGPRTRNQAAVRQRRRRPGAHHGARRHAAAWPRLQEDALLDTPDESAAPPAIGAAGPATTAAAASSPSRARRSPAPMKLREEHETVGRRRRGPADHPRRRSGFDVCFRYEKYPRGVRARPTW